MARYGLMPKTELPESKRPLDEREVTYLTREAKLFSRWHKFYAIAAVPATPIGIIAAIGAIYSLVVGDLVGVDSTQAFLVGMVVSVFGFAPLYLTFSMRDKAREVREILDTYPRVDEPDTAPAPEEPGEEA